MKACVACTGHYRETPRGAPRTASARRFVDAAGPPRLHHLVDDDAPDDPLFLAGLRKSLDCGFDSLREPPRADGPLEDQIERPPASKGFRPFPAGACVLRDPSTHVDRDARVQGSIPTPHDIDRPRS